MKKLLSFALTLILSLTLLVAPALAWESHLVDMDEVGVDVGASDWAVSEIKAAYTAGLIPELTNNPNFQDSITRLQFAELAVTFAEKATGKTITPAADTTFKDCKDTAVLKAYAAGIVSGVGNDQFAPDTTTNREQIAAMIYRAITYINTEGTKQLALEKADVGKFTDQAQVSAWALEGMGILAANGIMAGTSATTLSPKNACTVEQSILLLYRAFEKYQAAS